MVVGDSNFVLDNVDPMAPVQFALESNYPNPFNPVTNIKFNVPDFTGGKLISKTSLTLDIYNIRGQAVARLVSGMAMPGYHNVQWMGKDAYGKSVASGIYFYKITVMDYKGRTKFVNTRKMVMIK